MLSPGSQDYSLIISVGPPPPVSSGFIIDEDFSGGLPAGWSVDTLRGIPWSINTPVPGGSRLDNLTGGSGNFAMVNNDWVNNTVTSLRMPTLDLSLTEAAVLGFNSILQFDTFESINVDVSTNGGANWTEVWTYQGFNPFPVHYVLDLSSSIAGQSSATIRFRFDSEYEIQGDLWQIDNVQLEAFGGVPPPPPPEGDPPGQAANPNPGNGVLDMGLSTALSWSAGILTTSHDVYFGTSSSPAFQQNQAGTTFNPSALLAETLYYWRVDEVNVDGTTQGITWSFTTEAAPAPEAIHVGDLDASRSDQSRNRWQATATVLIHDKNHLPLVGAFVEGVWGNGSNGSGSCTTVSGGQCSISKGNLKAGVASVSFAVTSVTHAGGQLYDAPANHDPESDSDGSSIVIPYQAGTGNASPTAVISSPANGATYASGATVSFSGSANDVEDGGLSGSLSWTSDINGSIGSGGSFSTAALSDGSHTITATITDSGGAGDSASIGITIGSAPAITAHVHNLVDDSQAGRRNRWNAVVTVSVNNAAEQPVSGAVVSGNWSAGASGSGQCTTDSGGSCPISKNSLKSGVSGVTFSVTDVTGTGVSYDAGNSVTSADLSNPL